MCISGTAYATVHGWRDCLCDAIVFVRAHPHPAILAVDLKSGRIDVDEVVEQLRNGAEVADRLGWPERERPTFLPVVLSGRRQDPNVHRLLQSPASRVRFRSRPPIRIDVRPCGTALGELLGRGSVPGLGGNRGPKRGARNLARNGSGHPPG
jgi:hypothetical protein